MHQNSWELVKSEVLCPPLEILVHPFIPVLGDSRGRASEPHLVQPCSGWTTHRPSPVQLWMPALCPSWPRLFGSQPALQSHHSSHDIFNTFTFVLLRVKQSVVMGHEPSPQLNCTLASPSGVYTGFYIHWPHGTFYIWQWQDAYLRSGYTLLKRNVVLIISSMMNF